MRRYLPGVPESVAQWFSDFTYDTIPKYTPAPIPDQLSTFGVIAAHKPQLPTFKVMSSDAAAKTGVSNDVSVWSIVVGDGSNMFVEWIERQKVEFTDLVEITVDPYHRFKPQQIAIEDPSNGTAPLSTLRRASGRLSFGGRARSRRFLASRARRRRTQSGGRYGYGAPAKSASERAPRDKTTRDFLRIGLHGAELGLRRTLRRWIRQCQVPYSSTRGWRDARPESED